MQMLREHRMVTEERYERKEEGADKVTDLYGILCGSSASNQRLSGERQLVIDALTSR